MRLALGIALAMGTLSAAATPVFAEDVSAEQITRSLKAPLTRSITSAPAVKKEDRDFIKGLQGLTRQITIEEAGKITEVVEYADLPQIDLTVEFEFDSDELTTEAIVQLAKLGAALTSDELAGSVFVLAGHTDAKGSAGYNLDLSQRRAHAVKRFLVSTYKGEIDPHSLIPVGYGEEQLANEYDPDAPENRRVTVINAAY